MSGMNRAAALAAMAMMGAEGALGKPVEREKARAPKCANYAGKQAARKRQRQARKAQRRRDARR